MLVARGPRGSRASRPTADAHDRVAMGLDREAPERRRRAGRMLLSDAGTGAGDDASSGTGAAGMCALRAGGCWRRCGTLAALSSLACAAAGEHAAMVSCGLATGAPPAVSKSSLDMVTPGRGEWAGDVSVSDAVEAVAADGGRVPAMWATDCASRRASSARARVELPRTAALHRVKGVYMHAT
jgi:hypothetical protein